MSLLAEESRVATFTAEMMARLSTYKPHSYYVGALINLINHLVVLSVVKLTQDVREICIGAGRYSFRLRLTTVTNDGSGRLISGK